jgi:hypothetical protein
MAKKNSFPTKTVLATAALGIVAYKGISFLDTASNLTMDFAGVEFKDLSAGKLRLVINLRFLNPTGNDIKLEYILANIKLSGDLIGAITDAGFKTLREKNPSAFVLKAKNATTLPITISMPLQTALINVLQILIDGKTKRPVSVEGFWKAEGVVRQPFNIGQELSFG